MGDLAAKLLAEALRLPDHERAEVTARLMQSLEPCVETAWDAEILQRLHELRTGQAQTIPWPEARRMFMEDTD
ncbi:MAG TPA: addiction module protein, partial [Pirellulales bacterium]|nr:addiction module protein [Pirellulales bacterium]